MSERQSDATSATRETYRSFVNTWECDENDHLNVQFYFRAFQQAAEIFALQAGLVSGGARSAIVRHVRYHRELRRSRSYIVRSGIVSDGTHGGSIVHLLSDAESGVLNATALDRPGYRTPAAPLISQAQIAAALPRGVEPGVLLAVPTRELLASGKAVTSNHSIVLPGECGSDGAMLSNALVSRFTDGAPHVWAHYGISTDWLTQTGHGRVAVEMKLTRLAEAKPGDGLRQFSWMELAGEKTFLLRHQIENVATGEAVATGHVCGLVMDLSTRKAVALPKAMRDRIS